MRAGEGEGRPPAVRRIAAVFADFLLVYAGAAVVPTAIAAFCGEESLTTFMVLGAASAALGLIFRRIGRWGPLEARQAMAVCAVSWLYASLAGAWPLYAALPIRGVDAVFESVSGFTTTGMTTLQGLERLPRSVLFWRCFSQYLGGMGILTFFLFVGFRKGTLAHRLFSAEGRHLHAGRPTPSIGRTVMIFVLIYLILTVAQSVALRVEGVGWFDSVTHSMTTVSTAGFSNYDDSVGHFARAGYRHAGLIEATFVVFMLLSGVNFLVLYRLGRREISALWDSGEIRWYWGMLTIAGLVVTAEVVLSPAAARGSLGDGVRAAGFQVAALTSTTGFLTRPLYDPVFMGAAREVFLVLMLVGACAGSTGGGLKMIRAMLLGRVALRELRRATIPGQAVTPLIVDGKRVEETQVSQVAALALVLGLAIALTSMVVAASSGLRPAEALSVSLSAVNNAGPAFVTVATIARFPAGLKALLAAAMLVGRLEVFPVVAMLSRRTWR